MKFVNLGEKCINCIFSDNIENSSDPLTLSQNHNLCSLSEYRLLYWSKSKHGTGKSWSEALIFASTNTQYDNRFFIELQVQYMKIPSSNLGRTCCVQKLFLTFRTIFVHNMFSPCSAKRRASDKDLPVQNVCLVLGCAQPHKLINFVY